MKSGKQLLILTLFFALIVGPALSGCLRNLRYQTKAAIVIEDVPLSGEVHIKDDGWVEVKRMKASADSTTFLAGITFSRIDLVIRDAVEELAYPSVLQWMVFRGALVEDGFPWEVSDFIDNKFYFHRKVTLYADVPKIISLSVRLFPSGRPALIGFILSGYQLPESSHVVYHEPNIGNELVVIHPASIKDSE